MGDTQKVIIVGGVAGGATVAARLRRLDERAEIVMFERGEYISFANCGLPYHIGGVIPCREDLLVQTVEGMQQRYALDVRTFSEVLSVDPGKKSVRVKNLKTNQEYEENYDKLVLAPGAAPLRPPIPGIQSTRVKTLRSMADMDDIIEAVGSKREPRVVVVGGGFIGVEMAENLLIRGAKVSLVEMADQVMAPLDREMAAMVHVHMRAHGLDLRLSAAVTELIDTEDAVRVCLKNGEQIEADTVVLAIGVRPECTLAQKAGLVIGPRRGILVDSCFRTSDPHIYALGDAAEFNVEGQTSVWVPLAGPANRQGRLLADHLAGRKVNYTPPIGTAIAQVFELAVASAGLNERAARAQNMDVLSTITHSYSHATYFPGAETISTKLVFLRSGRLVGAQVLGKDGVDKRIDVLATAIQHGMNTEDLSAFELAYAPPFGSAKDPVNIAGYVASNVLHGEMPVAHWREVHDADPAQILILDVRTEAEWDEGHIAGSHNIPLTVLRQNLKTLPKEKQIILYCRSGQRAWVAMRILQQNGFNPKNLMGSWLLYRDVYEDMRLTDQI